MSNHSVTVTANRRLRIFRLKDGKRIPYTIELDNELTVVAEYADTTDLDHPVQGRSTRSEEMAPERKKAMTMARWATKAVAQNPIPGTEDLREDFFTDLENLQSKHITAGTTCPACEVGKLVRRYRARLEEGGWL
jgi:hypothetical protein